MTSNGSTVVETLTTDHEIEGSNPAVTLVENREARNHFDKKILTIFWPDFEAFLSKL